eukprot:6213376-Pleurochrysis_carterae.AAC.2
MKVSSAGAGVESMRAHKQTRSCALVCALVCACVEGWWGAQLSPSRPGRIEENGALRDWSGSGLGRWNWLTAQGVRPHELGRG